MPGLCRCLGGGQFRSSLQMFKIIYMDLIEEFRSSCEGSKHIFSVFLCHLLIFSSFVHSGVQHYRSLLIESACNSKFKSRSVIKRVHHNNLWTLFVQSGCIRYACALQHHSRTYYLQKSGVMTLMKFYGIFRFPATETIWSPTLQTRQLPVGDALWIARHKVLRHEYVLDFIVERKRVEDLWASIKDNRYKQQKLRLQVKFLSYPLSSIFLQAL